MSTLRRLAAAGAVVLALGACGGGDDSASTMGESAETALLRQLDLAMSDQTVKLYAEVHPAQQALFTVEQYDACLRTKTLDLEADVLKQYTEAFTIPGTGVETESTALVTQLSSDEESGRTTFHEIALDGAWRFTVTDPDAIAAGTC